MKKSGDDKLEKILEESEDETESRLAAEDRPESRLTASSSSSDSDCFNSMDSVQSLLSQERSLADKSHESHDLSLESKEHTALDFSSVSSEEGSEEFNSEGSQASQLESRLQIIEVSFDIFL